MSKGMGEFERIARMIGPEKAETLATSLGRGGQFKEAIQSELGQLFLGELVDTIQRETLNLVEAKHEPYSPAETDCRAEIRIARRILNGWAKKLGEHDKELQRWDKLSKPRS